MAVVYLIEDDPQFRALLRSTLLDAGHRVIEAAPHVEPVTHYRREPVSIVVVDLFAKTNDGLRAALAIRREFPTVHVIGISRVWTVWSLDALTPPQSDSLDDTVAQPFGAESLLEVIRRAEAS